MTALPLEKLGGSYDGGTQTVDRSRVSDYAAATNDPYPGYELGLCAPPLFGAVLAREAVRLAVADMVPAEALPTMAHGEHDIHVDGDQTFRYAAASGDDLPVHVDDQAARRAGLPAMVVHGLCTLAMATRALLDQVSDGDPLRLKRLAARFAANVFPGDDVVVGVHVVDGPRGRRTHPFQAFASDGRPVLRHGLAEMDD